MEKKENTKKNLQPKPGGEKGSVENTEKVLNLPKFLVLDQGKKYAIPNYEVTGEGLRSTAVRRYKDTGNLPDKDELLKDCITIDICSGPYKDINTSLLTWDGESMDDNGQKIWKDVNDVVRDPMSDDVMKIPVEYNEEDGFYYVKGRNNSDPAPNDQFPEDQVFEHSEGGKYILAYTEEVIVPESPGVTHEGLLAAVLYDMSFRNKRLKHPNVEQALIKITEALMWLRN